MNSPFSGGWRLGGPAWRCGRQVLQGGELTGASNSSKGRGPSTFGRGHVGQGGLGGADCGGGGGGPGPLGRGVWTYFNVVLIAARYVWAGGGLGRRWSRRGGLKRFPTEWWPMFGGTRCEKTLGGRWGGWRGGVKGRWERGTVKARGGAAGGTGGVPRGISCHLMGWGDRGDWPRRGGIDECGG